MPDRFTLCAALRCAARKREERREKLERRPACEFAASLTTVGLHAAAETRSSHTHTHVHLTRAFSSISITITHHPSNPTSLRPSTRRPSRPASCSFVASSILRRLLTHSFDALSKLSVCLFDPSNCLLERPVRGEALGIFLCCRLAPAH
jgi:hypothetical protein